MKIFVIGSGGREHALVWKLAQPPEVKKIYCAPGNAGIAGLAECVPIAAGDIDGLTRFAAENKIDLTVIGPELPLALGLADGLRQKGLAVFGPGRDAGRLEASKVFSKTMMRKYGVPTAGFEIFTDYEKAINYLRGRKFPLVVKADGLCAGKGVAVCHTAAQAQRAVTAMMRENIFQDAGRSIIIEECLEGEEASILVLSDGRHIVPLASSQDHKRIFDNDRGPNTGGMGAFSPAPLVTDDVYEQIRGRVLVPVIDGLRREGISYNGVLYAGIMMTAQGPMVLEFNVRFGDPEAQAVLPRLKSDLAAVMLKISSGDAADIILQWDERVCICVVLASGGYPGKYETGREITGLESLRGRSDLTVFHAGTKKENGKFLTAGGRVLGITGLGKTIREARERAYAAVREISFADMHFRTDIGKRALERSPG